MNSVSPDDLLNRAFRLGYFLHGERNVAVQIAVRAMNKLQLAATAQGKRLYYRLTGRADTRRKARSKVTLSEPHLLQRLVFVESEEYERQKERAATTQAGADDQPARESDLVIYFVKHLVRITTKRNSFYVTLGLSRLLYNYTTAETMELYNLIVQDPERVHDDYYYRSRKGVLLKEMKERFGALVCVVKGARGEERWQACEKRARHAELVRESLQWFMPWATPCVVPERFDPLTDTIAELNFTGRHPDEEHEVEVNRIHAALHPDCYARLTTANGFDAPDERLELPHFFFSAGPDDPDATQTPRKPPPLSDAESRVINELLAQEAVRRKAAAVGLLRVMVDGVEQAQVDASRERAVQFFVSEGAEVIEVYSADENGALLLATHLLNFNDSAVQPSRITLEGGQRISFTVRVQRDADGAQATGAQVTIAYEEAARAAAASLRNLWTSVATSARGLTEGPRAWWKPAAVMATLALLLVGAWWLWSARQGLQPEVVQNKPTPAPTVAPQVTPRQEVMPTPPPDSNTPPREPGREPRNERERRPTAPPERAPQINNEPAPAPQLVKVSPERRNPPARDETFVQRTIVPDANPGPRTRQEKNDVRGGWDREVMGKPLDEVKRVYIEAADDDALSQGLRAQLRARLSEAGNVQFAEGEQADAALKISVRPSAANPDDRRAVAIVRAVNATGYVVWPASGRGSSWRYIGRADAVAARIVADLTKAISRAQHRRR